MKLRKLFAGVAAAATLLGGLAFGTTANAVDPVAVDGNGIVTSDATFKFTAEDANQWGPNNNRTIKAYKIGDYKQNGAAGSYYYTLATPTTPGTAKTTLTNALNEALKGAGANGADVTVPTDANTDPLAWAVENKYLDASGTKPYAEGTTRALADALQAAEKDKADDQADFAVTTLTKDSGLTAVKDSDGKSYTATLSAGLYLFLDTTAVDNNHVTDGEEKDQNSANAAQKQGGVIVNSAAMIVASGTLVTDEKSDDFGKITDPVNGDNTVNLKNHVTPVAKSHDDKDNTVSEGQKVGYTLTTTIPAFTTGYKDYTFALADTPGAGQTVDLSNLKVYVDGEADEDEIKPYDAASNLTGYELTTPDNYDAATKTFVAGDKTFSVDLTKFVRARQYDSAKSGAVKVTYSAIITSKKDPVTNKVQVQDNGNDNHAEDNTSLSLGKFSFTKVDADGNAVKTKDAKFKITAVAPTDANATAVAETPTTATATSDENGKVTFEGLADGTYTVEETSVPEGFLGHTTDGSAPSVAAKFEVTIKGGKAVYFKHGDNWGLTKDSADNTQSGTEITDYTVKNVKSITQLPLTGAAGIGLFTVVALLLAGAGVTVFAKSRSTKRALRA